MKNREIKFRGIYPHSGQFFYGFFVNAFPEDCPRIVGNGFSTPVKLETVGEYTGLLDKNGVEIYEGDICRILYTDWPSNTDPNIPLEDYLISISHVGAIEYHAPSFYIMLKDRYDELSPMSLNYGTHGRLEVIGTIHTTPELL